MNIVQYIKSLLPKFGKDRVFEDSRIIKTEIETVSLPSYKEAEKVFTGWVFKSIEMKEYITVFNRNIKGASGFGSKDNIITTIRKGLEKLLETQEVTEERLQSTLEDDIVTDGITCLKANLIRVVEGISFVSKYSTTFLNFVYVAETSTVSDSGSYIKDNFSPAEIEYIEKNFTEFCLVFAALTKSKQEMTKVFDQIPDVTIGAGSGDAVVSTLGNNKLDPLAMHGFSTTSKNPIYHIGLMVAEWQANNYKRSKETKKVLELRLLNLQLMEQKNPDAKLEKEIAYIQSRIQGLDHKIQQMEASVR